MRSWIKLFENLSPEWFTSGKIVDINDDKWDALEFLDGDEHELEWRYCLVPAAVVQPALLDPEESGNRIKDIEDWLVDHPNGVSERPPIAIYDGTDLHILDGNHRSHVHKGRGNDVVPMLVATTPVFQHYQA